MMMLEIWARSEWRKNRSIDRMRLVYSLSVWELESISSIMDTWL